MPTRGVNEPTTMQTTVRNYGSLLTEIVCLSTWKLILYTSLSRFWHRPRAPMRGGRPSIWVIIEKTESYSVGESRCEIASVASPPWCYVTDDLYLYWNYSIECNICPLIGYTNVCQKIDQQSIELGQEPPRNKNSWLSQWRPITT